MARNSASGLASALAGHSTFGPGQGLLVGLLLAVVLVLVGACCFCAGCWFGGALAVGAATVGRAEQVPAVAEHVVRAVLPAQRAAGRPALTARARGRLEGYQRGNEHY